MRRLLLTTLCICILSGAAFAQTSGSPGGLVVFEAFGSTNAANTTQAGVLPGVMSTDTVLFANASIRLSQDLGVAIVNPNGTTAHVIMTLRNGADGTTASVATIPIGPRQQVSEFLSQLFSASVPAIAVGFTGALSVTSDSPVAITALRFRGTNFSTVPITNLSGSLLVPNIAPGVGGVNAVIMPQFAAGGIWSSNLVISNTTILPLTVRVDLFKQDGTPLTTVFNGQSGSSFQNIVIPPSGILIDINNDPNPLQVGYAVVTPIDTIAPTVTFTAPSNLSTNVSINQKVTATFSKSMDPATISTATFTLAGANSASTSGAVSYANNTATFTPASALLANTAYSATVTTGAKDLAADLQLASNFVWTFTTGAAPASPGGPAPTVTFTVPPNAATAVPINQILGATFSEAMDPTTITSATFTLTAGAMPISGVVSYFGVAATFAPSGNLTPSTVYTATITTGAMDLAGNALATNYRWSFTTAAVVNGTPPAVTFTNPANNATNVTLNQQIAATFSKAMDPSTMTNVTFTLKQGATPVTGTVSYAGVTATFSPLGPLAASTLYTAAINTGGKDLFGNPLASNYVWTFTTGVVPNTTTPTVISRNPASGATGVAVNTKVAATFSVAMDPLTITTSTFTLQQGASNISGTVTLVGATATFSPLANLANSTIYTATITTGARDLSSNALAANVVWSFTAGAAQNTTSPTVISVNPLNLATGAALNATPSAIFSEAIDPLTLTTTTFLLAGPGVSPVTGAITYNALTTTATFTPLNSLLSSTTYTATITTGVKDLAGNDLAADFVWSFTTVAPAGPATVVLGAAGPYAILAGAGVTNSGPTIINGSLGTSPTGTLTGSPTVAGSIDLADPAAAAAKLALTTAYNDAAGRTLNAISLPGDLSGLTLAPGLYKNSTSVMLSSGNVTLDAKGDPNATWIFQMGSTLTTIAGTQVVLAGGAKAANIFWQVGSSATLGTTSIFYGNILAAISISANTGAVIQGRLLTQTGAVSLLSNTVTVPGP